MSFHRWGVWHAYPHILDAGHEELCTGQMTQIALCWNLVKSLLYIAFLGSFAEGAVERSETEGVNHLLTILWNLLHPQSAEKPSAAS